MALKLPVIKPRTYLSPSAFQVWMNCPQQFYFYYLAGYPFIERKQNYTAALGSAFDAFLKDYIMKKRGLSLPHVDINHSLLPIRKLEEGERIIAHARNIAKQYIDAGFCKPFLEAREIYLETERYCLHGGIPLLGVLDMVIDGIPFDWKMRNFGSNNNVSPTPGYCKRFNSRGREEPPYNRKVFLEHANEPWAIQTLWYNWLLGARDKKYIIHEIINKPQDDDWELCIHMGTFTQTFIEEIRKLLEAMWENINNLYCEIPVPQPTKMRCHKYSSTCEVAQYCNQYKVWLAGQ